jgi:TonB family protein
MFASFYQLREQPFGAHPDPAFLYLSKTHREVFSSLIYRIKTDCGFLAMIAEPGMGKTTLLFHLLNHLQTMARTAFIFQTQCTSNEFMRYLLSEFGYAADTTDPVRMSQELKAILVAEATAGRRCIVLIDEAQNLKAEVLETIRLLSDFETPRRKLLQIILSGQLELEEKLANPSLSQLRQRLSSIARLHQFGTEDTVLYIAHRLKMAGHKGELTKIFDPPALARIVMLSGGIPRVINNVCFNALSLGFAIEARRIDSAIIDEVASDLCMARAFEPDSLLLSEVERAIEADVLNEQPHIVVACTIAESAALATVSSEAAQRPAKDHSSSLSEESVRAAELNEVELKKSAVDIGVLPDNAAATVGFAAIKIDPHKKKWPGVDATTKRAPAEEFAKKSVARCEAKVPRTKRRFIRMSLGRVSVGAQTRFATGLAALLGLGVFATFQDHGVSKNVEAKTQLIPAAVSSLERAAMERGRITTPSESPRASYGTPRGGTAQQASGTSPMGSGPSPLEQALKARTRGAPEGAGAGNPDEGGAVLPQELWGTNGAASLLSAAHTPPPNAVEPEPLPKLHLSAMNAAPPALLMTAPRSSRVVRSASPEFTPPKPIKNPPPTYPDFGRTSGLQGDVVLSLSISPTGDIQQVTVLQGNTILAAAARTAVLHWKYAPGLINGVPVQSEAQVTVRFLL